MEFLARITLGLLVTAIILLAMVIGGIRLALVNIEYFKPEIEYLITRDVAPEVVFTAVSGSMNRFNPILRIDNVSINSPDRSQPLFVDRLEVEIDFWASLKEQTLVILEISSKLEKLELTRDESGNWWADKLPLTFGSSDAASGDYAQSLNFIPRYLKIDLRRLIIRDRKKGRDHQIERVTAHINHRDDQFLMQVSAALPEFLGQGVLIKSVLEKNGSLVYVNTSNLQLQPLLELAGYDTGHLSSGSLDGELWAKLDGFELQSVAGDVVLKNASVKLPESIEPVMVNYQSRFDVSRKLQNWHVTNDISRLQIGDRNLDPFVTEMLLNLAEDTPKISLALDRIELAGLTPLSSQAGSPDITKTLSGMDFKGEVRNLLLTYDIGETQNLSFSATANDIEFNAFEGIPGVTNLNAEIVSGNRKLGLQLDGEDISLDFDDQFRAPLQLDQLSLSATANQHDFGYSISVDRIQASNPDASVAGRVWVESDQDERPFVYLRAGFKDAQAGSAPKYIPIKIMPEETIAWIDQGIRKGISDSGEIQFHGRLRDVADLERERSGEFFVDFDIRDAEVLFAPDWLPARNGEGKVVFHNIGVAVELDHVSYDNLDNGQATAGIADFTDPLLVLAITAEADTDDAVRIWIESPVGERFREPFSNLHGFSGQAKAELAIDLPLGDEGEAEVEVIVKLQNSGVMSENWGLDLSDINGRINVTNSTIEARNIAALYFGDAINIDIETDQELELTVLKADGVLETTNLINLLPEFISRDFSGSSPWQVQLAIANEETAEDARFLQISANSGLQGTSVAHPVPFAKQADEILNLVSNVDFYPGHINFEAQYGDFIKSKGRLITRGDSEIQLQGLDVAFDTELRPGNSKGLYLYGHVPEISLDHWVDTVFALEGDSESNLLQSAQLTFDKVTAFGHDLEIVNTELELAGNAYIGLVDSSIVRGNFQIPLRRRDDNPINIDLEYLRIDKKEGESAVSELLPTDLPDFKLKSQSIVFHDLLFNDLVIDARVDEGTLFVDELKLRRDFVNLNASGKWQYFESSQSHQTSVAVDIKGKQFGQAIAALGFGDSIRDGTVDLTAGFNWAAPIYGFSWEDMEGDAKWKLRSGTLNNVEPGSGRFVGLLSLGALPRRLSLDFSDLLIKGMDFDEISGSYKVINGDLFTSNTRMDGPAAKIKISGKTGIPTRDYDQSIKVTPKIRQTLPVLGAVSAGSAVGWGLLLLQNLFKKVIDKAVEVEYKVTGSWDDPKIELVKAVDENQRELPEFTK